MSLITMMKCQYTPSRMTETAPLELRMNRNTTWHHFPPNALQSRVGTYSSRHTPCAARYATTGV